MSIIEFLRERIVFLIINILILIFTGVLLKSLGVDSYPIIFILFINIIGILIFHIYDYIKRRNYYKEVLNNLDALDKKYLISEVIEEPNFIDGKVLYSIITKKYINRHFIT